MFKVSSLIREDREFGASVLSLEEARRARTPMPIVINGLAGGAEDAYLLELVAEAERIWGSPPTVLVSSDEERERIVGMLARAQIRAHGYKMREMIFNNISASHDIERERLSVLCSLASGDSGVIVTTPEAAMQITMPRERLDESSLSLRVGMELSPEELTQKLTAMGFVWSEMVEGTGAFSRRGGIVDFFSEGDMPIRVEFFGDEIDRLVYFDPVTQRAEGICPEVRIIPAREVVADEAALAKMQKEVDVLLKNTELSDEMRARLTVEREAIRAHIAPGSRDRYLGVIYEQGECLLDYLSACGRSLFIVVGTAAVRENAEKADKALADKISGLLSYGAVTKKMIGYSRPLSFYDELFTKFVSVHINSLAGSVGSLKLAGLFGFRTRRCVAYGNNPRMLFEDIAALRKGGYRILLLSESDAGAAALVQSLMDEGIAAALVGDGSEAKLAQAPGGSVFITVSDHPGFDLITPRIAVLSMARDLGREVMANKRRQRIMRKVGGATKRLMSHADLSVGDYVVHANYGIGLFEGMEAVTIDGVTKDYITIRYAGTDKLFVPCDRLEMIGKYIGDREKDGTVKLSRMGGTDWARTKARAKSAVQDIARDLIRLYAERQRRPGFAFPPDTELEDEFDSRFEYEETPSQLTAIEEIKRDMMRPVPMNRLLCGDVGFGKTEVALRAAFKAITAGKQVAMLVPTTILALQHYQTALSRMRGYAVTVEMLSRFKKPREREEIIKRTKRGGVDLLIGTHAILSKNVEFRDLGLLIIDEEQRFGVVQKERLREVAKNVDTLMLSATPIPRTLNMSMSGINDISVLDEAPDERRPVETYVMEHDDEVIADAIRRELARGGQVLYLYNKVEDIAVVAERLMTEIPEARVAYGHGKMEREELEDIWQSLVAGEIDVLVCTTIIETGVDLPNANTLVIENADRFGLSQLHQIRGRVGRSGRQAYAFFTVRRGRALSEVAEKRLEAIREFAEFGAGFKIALRDMEIRGAGNLLGAEQSGYIESVGYDLYMKLLNEAVLEERGEVREKREEATITINLSAHIPEGYIRSSSTRMEMYKKISLIESPADREEIVDEFCDRFGDIPKPVMRLIDVALCRALASEAGIRRVEERDGRITFVSGAPRLEIWSEVFAAFPQLSFVGAGSPLIVYRMKRGDDPTDIAVRVLTKYASAKKEIENE